LEHVRNRRSWSAFSTIFSVGLVALTLSGEMSMALLPALLVALWLPILSPQNVEPSQRRRLLWGTALGGLFFLLLIGLFVATR
jgi:4-hydroxybenzoate polyprenyltransferase